jgi:anti-sigma factor RsiW
MDSQREKIESLLVAELLGELTTEESEALEALLTENPAVDRYAFERAAAVVLLAAAADVVEEMPGSLRAKLRSDAVRLWRDQPG